MGQEEVVAGKWGQLNLNNNKKKKKKQNKKDKAVRIMSLDLVYHT